MAVERVEENASRWIGWPEIVRHLSSAIAVMLRDDAYLFFDEQLLDDSKTSNKIRLSYLALERINSRLSFFRVDT